MTRIISVEENSPSGRWLQSMGYAHDGYLRVDEDRWQRFSDEVSNHVAHQHLSEEERKLFCCVAYLTHEKPQSPPEAVAPHPIMVVPEPVPIPPPLSIPVVRTRDWLGITRNILLLAILLVLLGKTAHCQQVVYGRYSAAPTALTDGQSAPLLFDTAHRLIINCGTGCSGGGGGSNPAAGATGSAVPTSASYNGLNVGGNLLGQTGISGAGVVAGHTLLVDKNGAPFDSSVTLGSALALQVAVPDGVIAVQGSPPWTIKGTGTAGTPNTGVVTIQGISSMTKLLVTPDANSAINLAQANGATVNIGNGTAGTGTLRVAIASDNTAFSVNQGTSPWIIAGGGTAGSAASGVVTIQGIASMTKLLVTPDANSAINLAQVNGATVNVGNGTTSTGTQRVTIASDNTAFSVNAVQSTSPWIIAGGGTAGSAASGVVTIQGIASMTKLLVTPDANSSVNVAQINGVTPLMGNGVTGTGSPRVTIASDNTAFSVNSVQSGTWTVQPGNSANTTAWLVQPVPGTANGMSLFNLEPTASDNHANIKNGATLFYHLQATNKGSNNLYLRLYNAGSGFSGCASATNLVYSAIIPNGTGNGAGIVDDYPMGITFSTGLSVCVTGAYGQGDTTNAVASIGEINIAYK